MPRGDVPVDEGLRGDEGAGEVGVEDQAPLLDAVVLRRLAHVGAGVVHEDVQAPEGVEGAGKSSDIQANYTSEQIEDLPVPRTYRGLFQLAPGVSENGRNTPNAGASRMDNTYLIDGINVTNPHYGDILPDVTELDIAEVSIKRGGISADYGRAAGMVVNAVSLGERHDVADRRLALHEDHRRVRLDPGEQPLDHPQHPAGLGRGIGRCGGERLDLQLPRSQLVDALGEEAEGDPRAVRLESLFAGRRHARSAGESSAAARRSAVELRTHSVDGFRHAEGRLRHADGRAWHHVPQRR